jgi:thermitase
MSSAAPEPQQGPGQIIVKFRDNGAAAGVLRQQGLSDGAGIGSTGASRWSKYRRVRNPHSSRL